MPLNRESLVLDSRGDVFLLFRRFGDPSDLRADAHAHVDDVLADDPLASDPLADEPPDDELPTDDTYSDDGSVDRPPVDDHHPDERSTDGILTHLSIEANVQEVEVQVSSKHLSLASKVFNDTFYGKYSENNSPDRHNSRTISLSRDDFRAMELLLKIVHGLTRSVPRQVETHMLLQATILIDKYEFHEVAEVFTDMWFEVLRFTMPDNLHQDLASWIFICWVLKKPKEYKEMTKIAIRKIGSGLADPEAVVPYWIHDEIQSRRQELLIELLRMLSGLVRLYEGPHCLCSHGSVDCDALALGQLIRGLKQIGLYPIPELPSAQMSVEYLVSSLRALDISSCTYRGSYRYTQNGTEHLDKRLRTSLTATMDKIDGLEFNKSSFQGLSH